MAGVHDVVWHDGLLDRQKSFGIEGELLTLLENYLRGRNLKVVLQGEESSSYSIAA